MLPHSYMGLQVVHDQEIKEALERYPSYEEQETQKRGLLQTVGAFLAHFTDSSAHTSEASFHGCDGERAIS
jgi:hypothetical protein